MLSKNSSTMRILDSLAQVIIMHPGFLLWLYRLDEGLFNFFDRIYRQAIMWAITRVQGLTDEKLLQFQTRRFRRALFEAGNVIPYWRKTLKSLQINPEKITISQLSQLPILRREEMKGKLDYYGYKPLRGGHTFYTSGSSGIPLSFYTDLKVIHARSMFLYYVLEFNGFSAKPRALRFHNRAERNRFFGVHINVAGLGHLGEFEERRKLYSFLEAYKPEAWFTYPSSLSQLMRGFKEDFQNRPFPYSPRMIFTGSEHLLNREIFEKFFQCPIFDSYGTAETGTVAQECQERDGLHINPERAFFEIVDEKNRVLSSGEMGRILITFFDNKPTPFIRYDVGDIGYTIDEPCRCGRKTPRLFLQGKDCNWIVFPDGSRFPVLRLVRFLDISFGEIFNKFQLVQETETKITLRFVPSSRYDQNDDVLIYQSLVDFLRCGKRLKINFEKVDNIENLPSGKAQIFISKCL